MLIASLHIYGKVPLVSRQVDLTPMQKLFLCEAIERLKELEIEKLKGSNINKDLKDKYNKRKNR